MLSVLDYALKNGRLCFFYVNKICFFEAFPSRFGSFLYLIVRNHIIVLSKNKLDNLNEDHLQIRIKNGGGFKSRLSKYARELKFMDFCFIRRQTTH
jgi:hypothetical protein